MRRGSIVLVLAAIGLAACGSQVEVASSDVPSPTTHPTTTAPTTPSTVAASIPAELVDRTWVVDGVSTIAGVQPVPDDANATFVFDTSGQLSIHTGCNTGSASVTNGEEIDSLVVGPVALTEMACTDEALNNLESAILTVLSSPIGWRVDADTLSIWPLQITDAGLSFHASESTDSTDTTTVVSAPDDSAATDQAAILAAAAFTRIGVDNSFGGQSAFAKVIIVDQLGRADGSGFANFDGETVPMTAAEKAAIEQILAPATTVEWVESSEGPISSMFDDPPADPVAVLSLAVPEIADGAATIVTALWCGSLCGIGGAHTLERQPDGTWVVTGQTGPQWIS